MGLEMGWQGVGKGLRRVVRGIEGELKWGTYSSFFFHPALFLFALLIITAYFCQFSLTLLLCSAC